jgi:hypothetical protein
LFITISHTVTTRRSAIRSSHGNVVDPDRGGQDLSNGVET